MQKYKMTTHREQNKSLDTYRPIATKKNNNNFKVRSRGGFQLGTSMLPP